MIPSRQMTTDYSEEMTADDYKKTKPMHRLRVRPPLHQNRCFEAERVEHEQTSIRTDRHKRNRRTGRKTGRQAVRVTFRCMYRQKDEHLNRQIDRQTDKHTQVVKLEYVTDKMASTQVSIHENTSSRGAI